MKQGKNENKQTGIGQKQTNRRIVKEKEQKHIDADMHVHTHRKPRKSKLAKIIYKQNICQEKEKKNKVCETKNKSPNIPLSSFYGGYFTAGHRAWP